MLRIPLFLLAMTALLTLSGFPVNNNPTTPTEKGGQSVHMKNGETPTWVLDLMKAHASDQEVSQPGLAGWWI